MENTNLVNKEGLPGSLNAEGKPIYRLLTGVDDKSFCLKVSEALASGYELYGSPAVTFNGQNVIAAQAVIWKGK